MKAKKLQQRATNAGTELAESVQSLTKVKRSTKRATEKRADVELHVARSTESAENTLRQLNDSSRRVKLLKEEGLSLNSQLGEIVKARDSAVAKSGSRQKEVKALEARVRMLGGEMDSLKRRESANSDLEVMTRKIVNAQGDITNVVTGLHRDAVSSYDSIRGRFDGALVEVSRRRKEAFDRKAQSLQQSVGEAVRGAPEGSRWSFVSAPAAIDKNLGIIVGRAAETGGSAKPKAASSHSASRGAQAGASRDRPSSGQGWRKEAFSNAMLNLPGAYDPRDHSGYGA